MQPCKFRAARPSQVDIQEIGPKHADLQLAIKPRVAAHTAPRDPGQPDLQLAKKPRVAAHTARPKQPDLQLAKKPWVAAHTAKPRQPDLQLAMKPRVAAHTAKPNATGPTTCKEAARGCPHTRRSELQVSTYN